MGRHRSGQAIIEPPGADGIQCIGIDFERCVDFLEGQQFAAVPDDVGVGQSIVLHTPRGTVVLHRVERIDEAAPFAPFRLPLARAHPAVSVANATVLDVEHVQHAVASEPMVVAAGRKLRVRAVAVVRNVEVLGQFTAYDHVVDVALHPDRRVVPRSCG